MGEKKKIPINAFTFLKRSDIISPIMIEISGLEVYNGTTEKNTVR